jgi:hypothetical protein
MDDGSRLDEFDKDEFRYATRRLWPKGYTDEDFDRAWAEFTAMKRNKRVQ